jgi:iron complex outermembrane receptor protein
MNGTTPWRALEIAGSYTLLDRDNISSPSTPLTETPRHKGLVSVTAGPFARLRGMVSVEFEAGRETLNEGGHYYDVPAFAVVNAKVSWNVAGQLDIDVSGLNLSDRNYWVIDGYPEAGRVIRFAASWRF